MCLKDIGLRAHILPIILDSIVNVMGETWIFVQKSTHMRFQES